MAGTNNIQVNISGASKEMRAQRLKRLRKTTGLSRKDFSKKYNISPGTLQNWETARFGGLTEKGATLIISALKCEQIFCTFEWLMYQSGIGPNFENVEPSNLKETKKHKLSTPQEDLIVFERLNQNAIHLKIDDNTMLPHFKPKQLVAGTKKTNKQITHYNGHICIVKPTCLDQHVVRVIKTHPSEKNLYNLIHLNPLASSVTNLNKLYMIEYFAPIEWIRNI